MYRVMQGPQCPLHKVTLAIVQCNVFRDEFIGTVRAELGESCLSNSPDVAVASEQSDALDQPLLHFLLAPDDGMSMARPCLSA